MHGARGSQRTGASLLVCAAGIAGKVEYAEILRRRLLQNRGVTSRNSARVCEASPGGAKAGWRVAFGEMDAGVARGATITPKAAYLLQ